jgi:hypothetical protein
MEEDMCVDDDGAEFDNEDPEVVQPKSFALISGGDPALFGVSPIGS